MSIVSSNKLCFAYVKKPLLFYDINLNLNGGVLWLFGEPESGKTTLLELLCGMREMYLGDIFICDKPPKQSTQNISYLPEKLVALNNKTVQKNLEFAANAAGLSLDKIDYTDQFIAEFKNTKIKKLSPYNKAIFAIKRAELKNAKLLLIDINLTGLSNDEIINYSSILSKTLKNAKNRQIILACSAEDYKKLQISVDNAKYAYLFGGLSLYNSLSDYLSNIKYFGMAKYFYKDSFNANITSTINGYFLNAFEKTIKIDDTIIKPIETYFEVDDQTDVILLSDLDVQNLSETELTSGIKEKRIMIFDKLSGERLN